MTRQDLEFALQMFENAVALDPGFALALRGDRQRLRRLPLHLRARGLAGSARARDAAEKAIALQPDLPEARVAQAWILYASGDYDEAIARSCAR